MVDQAELLPTISLLDLRQGGPVEHARQRRREMLALREACFSIIPAPLRSVARPLAVTLNTRSVPSPVSTSPSCLTVTVRAEAPTISSSELIASAVLRVRW